MEMIRHDDPFIKGSAGEMLRNVFPIICHALPGGGWMHFASADFAKQAFALVGYQGDEIRPRLGIIVAFQADGTAVMPLGIVGHALRLRDWNQPGAVRGSQRDHVAVKDSMVSP